MALHRAVQRVVAGHSGGSMLGPSRGFQAVARPGPLYNLVSPVVASPPLVLPEHGQLPEDSRVWMDFPRFGIGGAMELMAVPKKKVSRHKKGIRNGPKALKPVPVIVRSTVCGRVKLPHFYCCSGDRGRTDDQNL
ncbi:uncharacterized protein LOC125316544 isoform X1 [Rhodamnia argentea]|uniref:Large ribosomal subunit protein bL32m n=1 Tax=Rhodamnia argentea TaxID=178133 RepID=A0ABM3HWX0_9MYRT|nr:uncharacterized protein LOC125316544 isoform X1 [Rhodamnia argentea]XP_048141102.1 uncharacterized protein LOC125316544 isoform X1 [Rhodamnia argentea]